MSQMLSNYLRGQTQTETQKKKLEKFVRAFNDVEVTVGTHLNEEFLAQRNKETIQNGGNE